MTKTIAPPEVEKEKLDELAPLYNVVLLDDDDHTYEYVIEMLQKLFMMSEEDAYYFVGHPDRFKLPVYRVILSDPGATRYYLDPDSGMLLPMTSPAKRPKRAYSTRKPSEWVTS